MKVLEGKKTYIASGILALIGVGLIGFRQTGLGLTAIVQAAAMVGLGDRANRHKSEILQAIQDGLRVAVDLKTGDKTTLISDMQVAVRDGARLTNGVTVLNCGGALPSEADLDVVADEAQAKAATAGSHLHLHSSGAPATGNAGAAGSGAAGR